METQLTVTVTNDKGEVLGAFKVDGQYGYAVYPESMMTQVIKEILEDSFEKVVES